MAIEVTGRSIGRVPVGYQGVFVERPEIVAMLVSEPGEQTQKMARKARDAARYAMPKVSGRTAKRLYPVWTDGLFGIWFPDSHVWFLERGITPFTMRSLAGKVIPMWIDDPTGEEQRKNPKAKTRSTEDGRQQVLIFRRAAKIGARKEVWRRTANGQRRRVSVPRSYPGAPGRIAVRDASGRIARGNTGVRWRHTGTPPEGYLSDAMTNTAAQHGYFGLDLVATDRNLTGLSEDLDVSQVRFA